MTSNLDYVIKEWGKTSASICDSGQILDRELIFWKEFNKFLIESKNVNQNTLHCAITKAITQLAKVCGYQTNDSLKKINYCGKPKICDIALEREDKNYIFIEIKTTIEFNHFAAAVLEMLMFNKIYGEKHKYVIFALQSKINDDGLDQYVIDMQKKLFGEKFCDVIIIERRDSTKNSLINYQKEIKKLINIINDD